MEVKLLSADKFTIEELVLLRNRAAVAALNNSPTAELFDAYLELARACQNIIYAGVTDKLRNALENGADADELVTKVTEFVKRSEEGFTREPPEWVAEVLSQTEENEDK